MQFPKRHRAFLISHMILLCGILLFPFYRFISGTVQSLFTGCFLHDFFFLYCPVCGGTRAVSALFRLDIVGALSYNAFVTALLLYLLVIDIFAWVRYFQRKSRLFCIPRRVWIVWLVSFVLFFLLRNYLMIWHGIDFTGDLGDFWNFIRNVNSS